jgi:DNA-binding MarR family transcriptional regulator
MAKLSRNRLGPVPPTRPRRRAGSVSAAPADRRDLIDGISAEWEAEIPEIATAEFELTRRAGRLSALLQKALGECLSRWELTQSEYAILVTLRSAGAPYELRPTDLKARVLMTAGGVSNTANRLVRAGLVSRDSDPGDKRGAWLRLTPEGLEVAEGAIDAWRVSLTELMGRVSPNAVRAASDALREVLLTLGDREALPARTREHGTPPT